MKKHLLIVFCSVLSLVVLQSCAPNDEKIQKEVSIVLNESPSTVLSNVRIGVVTLSGTVSSEAEKSAAEAAVKAVPKVKSVINNIEVVLPPPVIAPNDSVRMVIEAALDVANFKDVKVQVSTDNEVTLTGEAKKTDVKKILEIANQVNPLKLNNNLILK